MSGDQQHKPPWPGLYDGSNCSWYADGKYALVYFCRRITDASRRKLRTFNGDSLRAVDDEAREQLTVNMAMHRLGFNAREVG